MLMVELVIDAHYVASLSDIFLLYLHVLHLNRISIIESLSALTRTYERVNLHEKSALTLTVSPLLNDS